MPDAVLRGARPALALAAALAAGAAALPAGAAVPALVGYQGRLLRTDGTPEVGILPMTFSIHDAASGGAALWTETQSVAFTEGFYSILLGSVAPLPPTVTSDASRFLAVTVDGAELAPRQPIVSVAFALRAALAEALDPAATGAGSGLDADSVDGIDAAGFATAAHTHASYAAASHTHGPLDWDGPAVTLSGSTYTGTSFRAAAVADPTGASLCGAGYHVCYGWEMRVHSVVDAGMAAIATTRAWVSSSHTWSDAGNFDHSYGNDGFGGCTAGTQMVYQHYGLSRPDNHTWCDADTDTRAVWCCETL